MSTSRRGLEPRPGPRHVQVRALLLLRLHEPRRLHGRCPRCTKIGPTDKSYKLYVGDHVGKFYTKHLAPEQGVEFCRLWTAGEITWGYPGAPYVPLYIPGMSDK